MSKKLKKVLKVVAAIAIPFAAPLIAGSAALAGVAGAIGSTATSALVGAGLSAVTGNNPLLGAVGGGLGSLTGAGNVAAGTKLGQGVQGFFGGAADVARAAYPGAGVFTQGASLASQGSGGFLANLGKSVVSSVTDPNNLLRAGINLAGEYAASKAAKLTPQEQAMFNSLAEEQAWRMGITKEQYLSNKDLFDQAYAQVKQISPESEGQRYAASVSGFEPDEIRKVRMATPTNQPNLLEARERDLGIQQAERRASAFERGYEGGRQAQLAGLSGLKAPGAGESVAGMYPTYYAPIQEASRARGESAGNFVGGLGEIFFPKPRSRTAGLKVI
jgi:hypothetical protein